MTLVVDSSALYAAIVDSGEAGEWARQQLEGHDLAAPTLMRYEVLNLVRRHTTAGLISLPDAEGAIASLGSLTLFEAPFDRLLPRAWELRENFTAFDAVFIALAERLQVPLVTLDQRMARGPAVQCTVMAFDTQP